MRKKRRNNLDILIDLTSLLDVIFIILLIVVCNQQYLNNKLSEESTKAESVVAEAEAAKALYLDQIDTIQNYNELLSVYASYDPATVTERYIRVLRNDEEIETFTLMGNNVDGTLSEFKEYMNKYIQNNPEKPVVLSLNDRDENILYRDEKSIKKIFEELAEYPNVYLK